MASNKKQCVEFDSKAIEIKTTEEDNEAPILEIKSEIIWSKLILFCAIFCFKTLGMLNYISDVGSDILNAFNYLRTQEEWPKSSDNSSYHYTNELCDNWESYRHVKMGTLTLCIVFIPSTLGVLFLGNIYQTIFNLNIKKLKNVKCWQ